MKVSINSIIVNQTRTEKINGREFVVLSAMLIRGDTAMNGIFYSNDEVKASFKQLEDLPAPLGHPVIDGEHVSASNNFAKGEFDIGAFVRNVRMEGKEVHGEIFIDKEVAERTEQGKSLLKKIADKVKLGVSTGLNIAQTIVKNGVDELGKAFDRIGKGFSFDHLAILDGETAAGEHAGTEIIFNNEQSLFVINHEEGGQPDSKITGNPMEIKIDAGDLAKADRVKLQSMTAHELMTAVNAEQPEPTLEQATALIKAKGMTVNKADSVVMTKTDYEKLTANAQKYTDAETKRIDEIKEKIIGNSKMTTEDLANFSEEALINLAGSLVPENDFSVQGGVTTNADKTASKVDYS